MRTTEATVVISSDRRLVLQLPQEVAPGVYRVVVLVDEPASVDETPRRKGDGSRFS
jgi:hypothetical protein